MTIDYSKYPFSSTDPIPSQYTYTVVKDQLNYSLTGRQEIVCPLCKKSAFGILSKLKRNEVTHRSYKSVKTVCRHCHGQVTFNWNSVTY